jgi:hypothetical protein
MRSLSIYLTRGIMPGRKDQRQSHVRSKKEGAKGDLLVHPACGPPFSHRLGGVRSCDRKPVGLVPGE